MKTAVRNEVFSPKLSVLKTVMTTNNKKTDTTIQGRPLDKIEVLPSPELVSSGRSHLARHAIPQSGPCSLGLLWTDQGA